MAKHIGRRCSLGVAKEATRGTAVNPTFWVPFSTISFDAKTDKARSVGSFGLIQDADDEYIVGQRSEGDLEFEMTDKYIGLFLLSFFGSVSSAVKETTAYDHTFTIANTNAHQSLSILAHDPIGSSGYATDQMMFPLSVIDSIKINVEPQGIVMMTVGFKGGAMKSWSNQTTAFTAVGNKFLAQHLNLKIAANLAALGAASVIYPKAFEITLTQNTIPDFVVGTVQVNDNINQQWMVEGSVTLNRENNTYRDYMIGNTARAMRFDLLNGGTTIGASSNPELVMDMPRVFFSEWEQDRGLDTIATDKINFKAYYDATNDDQIIDSCVLTNITTSY